MRTVLVVAGVWVVLSLLTARWFSALPRPPRYNGRHPWSPPGGRRV